MFALFFADHFALTFQVFVFSIRVIAQVVCQMAVAAYCFIESIVQKEMPIRSVCSLVWTPIHQSDWTFSWAIFCEVTAVLSFLNCKKYTILWGKPPESLRCSDQCLLMLRVVTKMVTVSSVMWRPRPVDNHQSSDITWSRDEMRDKN